jgi:hypothetical protein
MGKVKNTKCLDMKEYVIKHKIPFRPDLVMLLIYKRDQILPMCVQKKAKRYLVPVKDCIHCKKKKERVTHNIISLLSPRETLCKKHASIYDYEQCKDKITKITYKDKTYYLFGEYILTEMPTDPDGFYVIWMGTIRQDNFSVYAINKKYFENIESNAIDITNDILSKEVLQLNEWILYLGGDRPIMENIKE